MKLYIERGYCMSTAPTGYEDLTKQILKQWEDLKMDLISKNIEPLSLDNVTDQYPFFDRFDQVVEASKDLFTHTISELGPLYRGTGINENINLNDYDRMIPTPYWVRDHNRMNPPGVAYLYLGTLPKQKGKNLETEKRFILKTISSELRAQKGDFYTVCRFESQNDKNIFDLSGDSLIPKGEKDIDTYLSEKLKNVHNSQRRTQIVNRIMAAFYFNLFNIEGIFKPINTENSKIKEFEYAPFQLLASYFKTLGYAGIKYRSTVYKGGTNLVLFDVSDVRIVPDSMELLTVKD